MADEEAPLNNKQAAPAKASSAWRLAVVVAVVLGLVAGYVAGDAYMNKTKPLELLSDFHPAPASGSEVISFVEGPEENSFGFGAGSEGYSFGDRAEEASFGFGAGSGGYSFGDRADEK